jgi:AraC-like DNA-binding protein
VERSDPRFLIHAGAGATEGTSRISTMYAVPLVLESLRVDPGEVLGEVGLDAQLFEDTNNLIPDERVGPMLLHCAARTGREDFALRVGAQARLDSVGLVGALAASAPDVGTALRVLSRFLGLNDGAAIASVGAEGRFGSLTYAVYESIVGTGQLYQLVGAVAFNVMRDLCGPEWTPAEIRLPCRRPRDVRPYRDFFRAPIRFDSHRMTIVFERHWFDRPLPTADRALHAALSAQAEAFAAQSQPGLPSQVQRVMRNLLLESKGSIETVARAFSMHRRTLDRHLDATGDSFRELADGVRFEVARQLLIDTQMSVGEIAASLHYGDASAFAHAFRRWSGRTPSQWRLARNHPNVAVATKKPVKSAGSGTVTELVSATIRSGFGGRGRSS